MEWEPTRYGAAVAELLAVERTPGLGPGSPDMSVRDRLRGLDAAGLVGGREVVDPKMLDGMRSGLWLWFDFLDESHRISQNIGTATGSFWHGIMHRREPDYGNAKYWFRRVNDHEIYAPLGQLVNEGVAASGDSQAGSVIRDGRWDPFAFVDLCQQACDSGSPLEQWCREAQRDEWRLLFDHCFRGAVGER